MCTESMPSLALFYGQSQALGEQMCGFLAVELPQKHNKLRLLVFSEINGKDNTQNDLFLFIFLKPVRHLLIYCICAWTLLLTFNLMLAGLKSSKNTGIKQNDNMNFGPRLKNISGKTEEKV